MCTRSLSKQSTITRTHLNSLCNCNNLKILGEKMYMRNEPNGSNVCPSRIEWTNKNMNDEQEIDGDEAMDQLRLHSAGKPLGKRQPSVQ